jgi:hypothetical protein
VNFIHKIHHIRRHLFLFFGILVIFVHILEIIVGQAIPHSEWPKKKCGFRLRFAHFQLTIVPFLMRPLTFARAVMASRGSQTRSNYSRFPTTLEQATMLVIHFISRFTSSVMLYFSDFEAADPI